jgi:hypothetical protein
VAHLLLRGILDPVLEVQKLEKKVGEGLTGEEV